MIAVLLLYSTLKYLFKKCAYLFQDLLLNII